MNITLKQVMDDCNKNYQKTQECMDSFYESKKDSKVSFPWKPFLLGAGLCLLGVLLGSYL